MSPNFISFPSVPFGGREGRPRFYLSLNLQEFAVDSAVNLINLLSNRYLVALQMEIEYFTCCVWFSLIANSVECASQMRERENEERKTELAYLLNILYLKHTR